MDIRNEGKLKSTAQFDFYIVQYSATNNWQHVFLWHIEYSHLVYAEVLAVRHFVLIISKLSVITW